MLVTFLIKNVQWKTKCSGNLNFHNNNNSSHVPNQKLFASTSFVGSQDSFQDIWTTLGLIAGRLDQDFGCSCPRYCGDLCPPTGREADEGFRWKSCVQPFRGNCWVDGTNKGKAIHNHSTYWWCCLSDPWCIRAQPSQCSGKRGSEEFKINLSNHRFPLLGEGSKWNCFWPLLQLHCTIQSCQVWNWIIQSLDCIHGHAVNVWILHYDCFICPILNGSTLHDDSINNLHVSPVHLPSDNILRCANNHHWDTIQLLLYSFVLKFRKVTQCSVCRIFMKFKIIHTQHRNYVLQLVKYKVNISWTYFVVIFVFLMDKTQSFVQLNS